MKEDTHVSLDLFLGASACQMPKADVGMGRDRAPRRSVHGLRPGPGGDSRSSLGTG